MRIISSLFNSYIKELQKLKIKKYRDEQKKFLIEGYHLIEEAKKAGLLEAKLVTLDSDYEEENSYKVSEEIINKLSFTQNPQKVIGVCRYLENKKSEYKHILLLDNISDPGNMGTIIRSALGFNIDTIFLNDECVDLYNDKVIRSTQGALFHINIIKDNLEEVITQLKKDKIAVYATTLDQAIFLDEVEIKEKYAIILGNEARGINKKFQKISDYNIKIPTNCHLESLNVAIAGAIVMYEFNRRKV